MLSSTRSRRGRSAPDVTARAARIRPWQVRPWRRERRQTRREPIARPAPRDVPLRTMAAEALESLFQRPERPQARARCTTWCCAKSRSRCSRRCSTTSRATSAAPPTMLGINRGTLRKKLQDTYRPAALKLPHPSTMLVTIRSALLSAFPTRRARRFRARRCAARRRAPLHRRHGAAARATRGSPVTRGRRPHRLSRDHGRPRQDAASEDPRRHARPPRRRRRGRCAQHGIAPIDLLVVNLYPFAADRRASPTARYDDAIENIDIGGPAMVRAAAKNHESRRGRRRSGRLRARARRARGQRAAPSASTRARGSREGVRAHRALRQSVSQLPARASTTGARRTFPQTLALQFEQAAGPALRREPAPAGGVLPRADAHGAGVARATHAAGQGAVVQQHRRRRHGVGMRAAVRRAGVRHRQARQSCGVAIGEPSLAAYRTRLPHRSHVRLRRHHRVQPRARRGDRARRSSSASSSR